MNYWLTLQWPPGDCTSVWLQSRFRRYAREVNVGDIVVVYVAATRPGYTEEDGTTHPEMTGGPAGVTCYGRVIEPFGESGNEPFTYEDGTVRHWQWAASLEPVAHGFIPYGEVCRILNRSLYRIGGGSGLMRITEEQFMDIQGLL